MVIVINCALAPAVYAADGGRTVNFRIMPIGTLLGEYMGDLSVALTRYFAVGVVGYSADVKQGDAEVSGSGYGARAQINFSGAKFSDSWTLSGYWYRVNSMYLKQPSLFLGNPPYTTTLSNMQEYGAVLGYQWVWATGFNMSLALGYRKFNWPQPIVLSNGTGNYSLQLENAGPKFEFSMGWAF